MGRGSAPAREISFVSLMAYGPKVSDSALAIGVTASETRQAVPNTLPLMFLSIAHPPLQQGMWESNLTLKMCSLNLEGCSPHPCLLKLYSTCKAMIQSYVL